MEWKYNKEYDCYFTGPTVYCDKPTAPEKQSLIIFTPSAYMNPDGTVNPDGKMQDRNGVTYTAQTVPVIYVNGIGGYRECDPPFLEEQNIRYLKDGYVLVSVGARGRQTKDESGRGIGKSPAALVDLKAGIRWLRANSNSFPGDMTKIISVGTSAGGAMSALLGITGNHPDYLPYLQEIGACMNETDDVFAAQCYCPIINLENADMAYEWMFGKKSISLFRAHQFPVMDNEFQRAISADLAAQFPGYINSLDLGLFLNEDGRSGSYYDVLMDEISASLTKFLSVTDMTGGDKQRFIDELNNGSETVKYDPVTGIASVSDLDDYVMYVIGRMKSCPAFDDLYKDEPENQEFGSESEDFMHFDRRLAELICSGRYRGLYGWNDEFMNAYAEASDAELMNRVALINPMNYIGDDNEDTARYFRIRHGSYDADTSFGIAFTLAQALSSHTSSDVDYAIVWGLGHCDADYPGEFSAWTDRIVSQ